MKTILLENGGEGMFRNSTKEWISKIDEHYTLVNSEFRTYMKSADLLTFAMLIDPRLTDLATMSSFPSIMGFEACNLNGRDGDKEWLQIEWYTWLIYEAVGFRKDNNLNPLVLHIAYEGIDFLKDVNDGDLGEDTKTYLKLMMRQSEGFIKIKLYDSQNNWKLKKTITNENQLKFTN